MASPFDDEKQMEHESFGMIGFSRISGNPGPLFGSSIKHGHFIRLSIKHGILRRGLNHNWYSGMNNIVELDLSYTQFAELLTTMNVEDGVPCTLRRVGVQDMAEPPTTDERTQFNEEFTEHVNKVMKQADALAAKARELLKSKSVKKGELAEIIALIDHLQMQVKSNMPYIQKQYNAANEKTVTQAKGEVEAFVLHKLHSLGIEALNKQIEAGAVVELVDGPDPKKLLE
jgi:hypothetical protein